MFVTRGQCDAKPIYDYFTARWLVPNYTASIGDRGTCVLATCPELHSIAERPGFEPATSLLPYSALYRTVTFQMTLSDGFQDHVIFEVEYLENGASYRQYYCTR